MSSVSTRWVLASDPSLRPVRSRIRERRRSAADREQDVPGQQPGRELGIEPPLADHHQWRRRVVQLAAHETGHAAISRPLLREAGVSTEEPWQLVYHHHARAPDSLRQRSEESVPGREGDVLHDDRGRQRGGGDLSRERCALTRRIRAERGCEEGVGNVLGAEELLNEGRLPDLASTSDGDDHALARRPDPTHQIGQLPELSRPADEATQGPK